MDLGLRNRRALVCGASRGLGFACAKALLDEGASVTLVSRDERRLADAIVRLEAERACAVDYIVADLATEEGQDIVAAACEDLDILVTNAGGPPSADFRELTRADWARSLEANFLSAVELIRVSVEGMVAREFGRIVNVTSMTVRMPVTNLDLSNATRLALTGYVAGVSRQLAPHNVTVNNLLPGPIATERLQELGMTADRLIEKVPAGRAGAPEEFGAACAFLCSAHAGFITGQNLLLDGGLCPITV